MRANWRKTQMSKQEYKKEVVIIQNSCPHNRVPFFNGLRNRLQEFGVKLRLLYGRSSNNKQYSPVFHAELPWAEPFTCFYLPSKKLPPAAPTWHAVLTRVLRADLIIVEAAALVLRFGAMDGVTRAATPTGFPNGSSYG